MKKLFFISAVIAINFVAAIPNANAGKRIENIINPVEWVSARKTLFNSDSTILGNIY